MLDLRGVVKTLTQERDALMQQIGRIDSAIGALLGRTRPAASNKVVRIDYGQRKLSKEARGRIAEAQRQRWAKVKAKKKAKHWTQMPKNRARMQKSIRAMNRAKRTA